MSTVPMVVHAPSATGGRRVTVVTYPDGTDTDTLAARIIDTLLHGAGPRP
ncbi:MULTISPECIES: hypothetical protein [Streptomyces]|nr:MULTISPECIES: hypothetical protein [Streptomyces]